jgi:hypothetical protein
MRKQRVPPPSVAYSIGIRLINPRKQRSGVPALRQGGFRKPFACKWRTHQGSLMIERQT